MVDCAVWDRNRNRNARINATDCGAGVINDGCPVCSCRVWWHTLLLLPRMVAHLAAPTRYGPCCYCRIWSHTSLLLLGMVVAAPAGRSSKDHIQYEQQGVRPYRHEQQGPYPAGAARCDDHDRQEEQGPFPVGAARCATAAAGAARTIPSRSTKKHSGVF